MTKKSAAGTITINEVSWFSAQSQLRAIRSTVFIEEQSVPPALEWDGQDAAARHLLACHNSGLAVACTRINDGKIERMAVLKEWRRQGIGMAMLRAAMALCRKCGWLSMRLSAQTHAIGFYQQAGFVICSAEYLDAGIVHQDMCYQHEQTEV